MSVPSPTPRPVLLLGATGTIGRATLHELRARGHHVTCAARPGAVLPPGVPTRPLDLTDPASAARDLFQGLRVAAVVSCLASRTGVAADAWAIDHRAHLAVLQAAQAAGAAHFVLLSALCVQKPRLAFQHAKLAFERALAGSGLRYSIVRPTAFFKSLSGQVARVRDGKPYLMFGDGLRTACKPIADADVAAYLADCLDQPACWNQVLPVGGPGDPITPRAQGELLFRLTGRPPRFQSVPVALLGIIAGGLGAASRVVPSLAAKAELARIGRYYATESMLVWDESLGAYSAEATPSFGAITLESHYAALLAGTADPDRREHAVF